MELKGSANVYCYLNAHENGGEYCQITVIFSVVYAEQLELFIPNVQ